MFRVSFTYFLPWNIHVTDILVIVSGDKRIKSFSTSPRYFNFRHILYNFPLDSLTSVDDLSPCFTNCKRFKVRKKEDPNLP